ncbi:MULTISPECIES: GH25 family lysozyme [Kitasatospora]|uniref:Peptidoglycan binding-like domain-containing protein n=1 Tax=Kitasatospora cystarginea TaxID=58350 RepID=A0ABP5RNY1_9ACTN
MGIYGQDWSSYQPATPDTSGLAFAFIKVTEGLTYTSPVWTAQRDHARAAGLVLGYYHYPHMANPVPAEATRFLSTAQPQAGELVVLDWEGYDSANSSVPKPDQLAYKEAWLRYVKQRLPHNPVGMYCNKDYWQHVDTTSYFADFLWIATSGRPAGQPGIQAAWLFHQYSDSGGVDQDYCHLDSADALRAWAASFQPTPTPDPGPAWPGEYLHLQSPMQHDASVRIWQQRMADRGWRIAVDGWYGPASAAVCRQFQSEKGLQVDGIVGPATWDCAFRTDNVT